MATIAGIAAVIIPHMTGRTFCIVVTIQDEILVVIEGRRCPLLLGMTLAAVPGDLLMERVGR